MQHLVSFTGADGIDYIVGSTTTGIVFNASVVDSALGVAEMNTVATTAATGGPSEFSVNLGFTYTNCVPGTYFVLFYVVINGTTITFSSDIGNTTGTYDPATGEFATTGSGLPGIAQMNGVINNGTVSGTVFYNDPSLTCQPVIYSIFG